MLFGRASRTRRERSIRPKFSRIDFDVTELENSRVRSGRPEPAVEFGTGEAARIVAQRALLMAQTPSAGCMMAVRASEKACSAAIDAVAAKCGSVVAVAAVNAPESTVLSGDYVAVSLVVAELAARNEARGADASKSKATKSATAISETQAATSITHARIPLLFKQTKIFHELSDEVMRTNLYAPTFTVDS